MCKFAYTSYEKILTDLWSFLRGLEFNNKEFLDYFEILDDIIIDICVHYQTNSRTHPTRCLLFNNVPYPNTDQ